MNPTRLFPHVESRHWWSSRSYLLLGALIILCLILPAYILPSSDSGIRPDGIVEFLRPDGSLITSIVVEIADTHEARVRGLQERRYVAQGLGMLFLFERQRRLGVWMRNTPVSLDILFVGADMRVLNISHRALPMSDMEHWSAGPAMYVVEVPAGFTERSGIGTNSVIRWQRFINISPPRP
jgi:uncharacterized membrane protein (UPF0127 family)